MLLRVSRLRRCPGIAVMAVAAISVGLIAGSPTASADTIYEPGLDGFTRPIRSFSAHRPDFQLSDTLELANWDDSLRAIVREHYDRILADTARNRIVDVSIQTNGDRSQLDSLGVDTSWCTFDGVITRVPANMLPAIAALPSVIYVTPWDPEQLMDIPRIPRSRGVVAGWTGFLGEFLRSGMDVRGEIQDTAVAERAAAGGRRVIFWAIIYRNGLLMMEDVPPGVYNFTFSPGSGRLRKARASVKGLEASPQCDEITVEGIRVKPGVVSLLRLDFVGAPVTGREGATDADTCRVEWQERFEPIQ